MSTQERKVYMSPKRQKNERKRANKEEQKMSKIQNNPVYNGPSPRNTSVPISGPKKYEVVPEDLSAFTL